MHCQGISQFYLHSVFHPQADWAIPAFDFPAAAGTHLPTQREGWKAELTLVQSSPGQDFNLQPPDYKSCTLPHSHWCTL